MATKQDDNFPNQKVYFPQGADRLAIDSDGLFDFYGSDQFTGTEMMTLMRLALANAQINTIAASAGVLSVINMPSAGVVFLSASIGCSNMSAWLTSCTVGARLTIAFRRAGMAGESLGSVYISLSGVTLKGLISAATLSSISITTSGNSTGVLQLLATADNEWSVIADARGKVVERSST